MRRILPYLFFLLLTATSCVDNDTYDDNPQGNLEALWRILDEHYCFFEEKGVDWNAVHEKYAVRMNAEMSESQQFEVMTQMISELRDGHVNLYTTFNTGRYWSWKEDYPTNFSDTLLRRYLRTDYLIAGGTDYTILDDNIGYLRYESFQQGMSDANLDQVMLHMAGCNGLIIDVRGNGGGLMTHAERLAARFCNAETTVGYLRHKTGRGHQDFSSLQEQTIRPAKGLRWQKEVVVLTNRGVFSAANEFVKYMSCFPPRHHCGRPDGRRRGNALLGRAAQRLGRTLLGLSDVRPRPAPYGGGYSPRLLCLAERRRLPPWTRHTHRMGPKMALRGWKRGTGEGPPALNSINGHSFLRRQNEK